MFCTRRAQQQCSSPILKLTSIIANFKHILQALRVAKLPQNQFGQKLQLVNILKFFVHKLEN